MILEQGILEIIVYQVLDLYNHQKTQLSLQDLKQLSMDMLIHLIILVIIQHRLKSKSKINLILSQMVDQILNHRMTLVLLIFFSHLQSLSSKHPESITIQQLLCIYLIIVHKFNKIFTFGELFFIVQMYQLVCSVQPSNTNFYFISLHLIKLGLHNFINLEIIQLFELPYRYLNIMILIVTNIYSSLDYISKPNLDTFQQILFEQTNIGMIQLWISVIIIGSISAYFLLKVGVNKIIVRKVYHLMAFIMFQQGIQNTPLLMYISFGMAIYLFIMIELIRQQTQHEFRLIHHLDVFIRKFIDHRDTPDLIISHLSLLIGCSLSLLFFSSQSLFIRSTGVLIMGIGDAFAAIIGKSVGYHRIGSSNKTWQGFIGCFITISVVGIYLFNQQSNCQYLVVMVIISLIESFTQQMDNLVLPFIFVQLAMLI